MVAFQLKVYAYFYFILQNFILESFMVCKKICILYMSLNLEIEKNLEVAYFINILWLRV